MMPAAAVDKLTASLISNLLLSGLNLELLLLLVTGRLIMSSLSEDDETADDDNEVGEEFDETTGNSSDLLLNSPFGAAPAT